MARCFFNQVQLHRELADLAFQRRDLRLILGYDARFSFFIIEFGRAFGSAPTMSGLLLRVTVKELAHIGREF